MTTRPTAPTDWADAVGANRATVPTAIRDLGVPPGDVFRSTYYNEALHDLGLWLTYLKDYAPSEDVLAAGRIVGIGNPLDASRALTISTELTGQLIEITATTSGSGLAWTVGGGASSAGWLLDRDTGVMVGTGAYANIHDLPLQDIRAKQGLVSGLRYAFLLQESLAIDISPARGGWTFQRATTGTNVGVISGSGGAVPPMIGSENVRLEGATNTGDVWRRPLYEIEPSAGRLAAYPVWQVADLRMSVVVASDGTVGLKICQKNRLTGVEAVFGSWSIVSNTTPTGSQVFSYTPGTPDDFNLSTYSYFLELDVRDNYASSQVIKYMRMTLLKGASD